MPRRWTTFFAAAVLVAATAGVITAQQESIEELRALAEQGVVEAQVRLGAVYYSGEDVPQDYAVAARWWRLAADQGYALAQYNLGIMYRDGQGVPQDDAEAVRWFRLATVQMPPGVPVEPVVQALPPEDTPPLESGRATGTAFIVDPSGLLLTAYHVVERATSISVSCNGGPAVPATIRSSSPTVDMALLQVEDSLGTEAFLTLASDNEASLGDRVFTIGYPNTRLLGLDPKYTEGTVSALSGVEGDASFLQISVPIQPGNSGGALVNERGDVLGVVVSSANVVRFVQDTGQLPQNISWAIKSNFARGLFPDLSAEVVAANDSEDVIERATKATCLVITSVPIVNVVIG